MCFLVTNKNFKTAKEDIVVYKIAILKDNNILSFVKRFNYSQEEIKPIKLKIKDGVIEQGYHSFCHDTIITMINSYQLGKVLLIQYKTSTSLNYDKIYDLSNRFYPETFLLLKCIIPKGTKYLINRKNQVVSELIKIDSYTKVTLNKTVYDLTFNEFYNLNKQ